MDDAKLFSKFLVAVYQMKFEKDAEISVDFINKSLFEEKLAADGSFRFVSSSRACLTRRNDATTTTTTQKSRR